MSKNEIQDKNFKKSRLFLQIQLILFGMIVGNYKYGSVIMSNIKLN